MMRQSGDLQMAEDCVQDAFVTASVIWQQDGFPDNPGAWIRTVAKRKLIDKARHLNTVRDAQQALAYETSSTTPEMEFRESHDISDDELALVFMCCHPAISATDQVMLILRLVAGLPPAEIATAFFYQKEAVRTRLLRAKRKIRDANIPFKTPPIAEQDRRLKSVLAAIYLIFNEGYLPARGASLQRRDLTREAIRLSRLLCNLVPHSTESLGLLALLLFTDARSPARISKEGDLVPLTRQIRTEWHTEQTQEALGLLAQIVDPHNDGIYTLQARIAAQHAIAATFENTNWANIVAFYERMVAIEATDVIKLNRAVALGYAGRSREGLAQLEELADSKVALGMGYLSAQAELYLLSGNKDSARQCFQRLRDQQGNRDIRRAIDKRIAEIETSIKR
jgi:RNA polymerase sigma-70 factor, ECF subfamily